MCDVLHAAVAGKTSSACLKWQRALNHSHVPAGLIKTAAVFGIPFCVKLFPSGLSEGSSVEALRIFWTRPSFGCSVIGWLAQHGGWVQVPLRGLQTGTGWLPHNKRIFPGCQQVTMLLEWRPAQLRAQSQIRKHESCMKPRAAELCWRVTQMCSPL